MKLGILVNSKNYLESVVGITKAANSLGHEVTIFAMDTGTFLLQEADFRRLQELDDVQMSFCEHSAKELDVDVSAVSESIISGSQYNNAAMNHNADKIIVL